MTSLITEVPPIADEEDKVLVEDVPTQTFELMSSAFPFLASKKSNELLTKWNLLPDLQVPKFKTLPRLTNHTNLTDVVRGLVSDPLACQSLGITPLSKEDAATTKIEELSCSILNMSFFDAVNYEDEVVTSSDYIRACMDETFDGIVVQDKLREMLVNPDSENSCIFKDSDKKEFIHHLLKLVCVGGALCQAEEKFHEWKEMTKAMYKDFLSVQKNATSGKVEITSRVFQVDSWGNSELFKKKNMHNKFYVVFDVAKGEQRAEEIGKGWVVF